MTKFIIRLITAFSILHAIPSIASERTIDRIEGEYAYSESCGSVEAMDGYSNKLNYSVKISRASIVKNEVPLFFVEIETSSCGPAHVASFRGMGSFDHSNNLVVFPYPDADAFMINEENYAACHIIIKETKEGVVINDTKDNDCKKLYLGGVRASLSSPGPIKKQQ